MSGRLVPAGPRRRVRLAVLLTVLAALVGAAIGYAGAVLIVAALRWAGIV